jgi:hypothetical protein
VHFGNSVNALKTLIFEKLKVCQHSTCFKASTLVYPFHQIREGLLIGNNIHKISKFISKELFMIRKIKKKN